MRARRGNRLETLLVVLVAGGVFTASCGSDGGAENSGASTGTESVSTDVEVAESTVSDSAAPSSDVAPVDCDSTDPIRVGVSNTLTGPSAEIGKITQQGFDLAAQELNDDGGVLGRCIELVVKDDEGEPTKAAQVVNGLIYQDEVEAILGPFLSSAMGATMPLTTSEGIVQIVLGTLPEAGDAATYPYVFRPENPSAGQAPAIAAFLERSGFERPAILAVNNGLGQSLGPGVKDALAEIGIESPDVVFHEAGLVDMTLQINELLEGDPDVLVLITIGTDAISAIKARGTLAPELPVVGLGVIADQAIIDAVGAENMANIFAGPTYRAITRPVGSEELVTAEATAFRDSYAAFVGDDDLSVNIQQPAAAYDDLMMLAAAITASGAVDADGIRAYLEEHGHDGIRGRYRFTADNHDGVDWRDTVFVSANSLKHGTLELAPGEE